MSVKRRDFQKAVNFLQEFLLKLSEGQESAELRDSLNMCLLHMQKYYKTLKSRTEELVRDPISLSSSLSRGFSPMTQFRDAPDRFQWKWVNLENPSIANLTKSLSASEEFSHIPQILQATKMGDVQTVKRIIDQDGWEVLRNVDGMGRNCVMYAVHYKENELLQFYLEQPMVDINFKAHDDSSAVHRACHDNNNWALGYLIDKGADINCVDVEGRTPLHWAATIRDDTQCLDMLLQLNEINISARDKTGMTAAMWACRMDCLSAFEKLVASQNAGSKINARQQEANLERVLNERDEKGWTCVHWSVRRTEPLHCLIKLLNSETGLQLKDDDGRAVLHVAAEQGATVACRHIIDICGEDCVNIQDNKGQTALHLAAMCGHGEIVNLLCEKGADLLMEDLNKTTAWDYAKGNQLRYCMLILQYYRQKLDGITLPLDNTTNGHHSSAGELATAVKSQFMSPRPPDYPQSRSSTPNTPRSRMVTSRSSTKRSSMAASINGSMSPPPMDDDERAMSTYRSSTVSVHGSSVYPQKKVKPNSPRDRNNTGAHIESFENNLNTQHIIENQSFNSGRPIYNENILVVHDGTSDLENGDVVDCGGDETNLDVTLPPPATHSQNVQSHNYNNHGSENVEDYNDDQDDDQNHTYEIRRPDSPDQGSDMTDVSLPMNVSDVDENDPPTVIHNPPPVQQPQPVPISTRENVIKNVGHMKKITLDINANPGLHAPQKAPNVVLRPETKSTVFGQNSRSAHISRTQNEQQLPNDIKINQSKQSVSLSPQKSPLHKGAFNVQTNNTSQSKSSVGIKLDSGGLSGANRRGVSPTAAHSLSPDSSLSMTTNTRTAVHSGARMGNNKRIQSLSPAKSAPLVNKNEEMTAALKEKQLAEIQFTPLHRRGASPGGVGLTSQLEPLPLKLSSSLPTHTPFSEEEVGAQRHRDRGRKRTKKKRAVQLNNKLSSEEVISNTNSNSANQSATLRSGRLQPLEASIQGSSYPIHHSAQRRELVEKSMDATNTNKPNATVETNLSPTNDVQTLPTPMPRKHLAAPLTATAVGRRQDKIT